MSLHFIFSGWTEQEVSGRFTPFSDAASQSSLLVNLHMPDRAVIADPRGAK
jgi:hypothetical protein